MRLPLSVKKDKKDKSETTSKLDKSVMEDLDRAGSEGWELVTVVLDESGGSNNPLSKDSYRTMVRYILKREKSSQ